MSRQPARNRIAALEALGTDAHVEPAFVRFAFDSRVGDMGCLAYDSQSGSTRASNG